MNVQANTNQASTMQEWASFLTVLNGNKDQESPLLKRSGSSERMIKHLEKQLPKPQAPAIFRRLGKHTQLVLHFDQVA